MPILAPMGLGPGIHELRRKMLTRRRGVRVGSLSSPRSPRAKRVDARPKAPKAWHDGLGQRRPRSEPDVRLGAPERLAVFPLDIGPRDADALQHLVAEVGQLLAGSPPRLP